MNKVSEKKKNLPSILAAFFLILVGVAGTGVGLYYLITSVIDLPMLIKNDVETWVIVWICAFYISMTLSMLALGISIILFRKKGTCEDLLRPLHAAALINAVVIFVLLFRCSFIYNLLNLCAYLPALLVLLIYTGGQGLPFRKVSLSWAALMTAAAIQIFPAALITVDSYMEYIRSSAQAEAIASSADFMDFEADCLDGSVITEDIFKQNKLTIVNCWETTCSPCVNELPELQALYSEQNGTGVGIIGICVDIRSAGQAVDEQILADAKEIIAGSGVQYPVLIPSEALAAGILREVNVFPTTFFVDSEGKVQKTIMGARDKEKWEREIQNYLNQ